MRIGRMLCALETIDIIQDDFSWVAWPEHSRLIWLVLEAQLDTLFPLYSYFQA